MKAIIKKDIQKRLSSKQLESFRSFRRNCNIKMLNYQIERYSCESHKHHNYFKSKTNNWTSPYWGPSKEEIILCIEESSGIGLVEILFCPCLGISMNITNWDSW